MADDTPNYAFPPKIAGAVIEVMKALGTLAKERENKFDHYEYASIDDFIEHVRAPMMDAGLFIIPSEAREAETREVTKKDGKPMVIWSSRFAFTLVHESGESYGPIFKTVDVQFNGAQAAGSSQSYAEKQLFRGLFLIKTGDKDDPDKEKLDISSKGEQQTDLQKLANSIRKKIQQADDAASLGLVWSDCEIDRELIRGTSATAHSYLEKEYHRRLKELENA
jgi:hypothetical protein